MVPLERWGDQMKQRLVDGTIELIQKKGFTFTISELAKQLAISKRTVYEHFSSKDELISEVINQFISQIKATEKEIAEHPTLDLLEKIKQILIFIPKDFELMNIRLLAELKKHHFHQWKILDKFFNEEWAIVLSLMERGIAEGSIKPIPLPLFIELYLGAINQIYDPKFLNKNQVSMAEMLQSTMDILLYGISNTK